MSRKEGVAFFVHSSFMVQSKVCRVISARLFRFLSGTRLLLLIKVSESIDLLVQNCSRVARTNGY